MGRSDLHVLGIDGLVADIGKADMLWHSLFPGLEPSRRGGFLILLVQDPPLHSSIYLPNKYWLRVSCSWYVWATIVNKIDKAPALVGPACWQGRRQMREVKELFAILNT